MHYIFASLTCMCLSRSSISLLIFSVAVFMELESCCSRIKSLDFIKLFSCSIVLKIKHELHYVKRSLIAWVGVIPKEAHARPSFGHSFLWYDTHFLDFSLIFLIFSLVYIVRGPTYLNTNSTAIGVPNTISYSQQFGKQAKIQEFFWG